MIIWMWVPLELVIDSSDVATGNQPSTSMLAQVETVSV